MRNQIASELRKLVSTRSAWTMLASLAGLIALATVAITTQAQDVNLHKPLVEEPFMLLAVSAGSTFALLLGLRTFTDEFRHGSIVPTLLASPDRRRVLVAKLVVTAIGGVVLAVAAVAVALAAGVPLLMGQHLAVTWTAGAVAETIGRLLGATVLWTMIGVGVGLAVRHQVAAIAGAFIWLTVGEGLLSDIVPGIAKYFPGAAADAVVRIDATHLLSAGPAAVVLTGWAAVATVVGGTLMARRDVA